MLKQRIITAVILSAVALWALLGWNDLFFALFLLGIAGACAWEWGNLVSITPRPLHVAYTVIATVTTACCFYLINDSTLTPMVLIGVVLWMAIVCDLVLRPVINSSRTTTGDTQTNWMLLVLASYTLLMAVCCLYWLRQYHGPGIVIYTIALVAAADTGAYFSGKKFGMRKLAVNISQGKTLEGAAGGLLLALAVAAVASPFLTSTGINPWSLFIMSAMAALFSIAGDLFISRAKRTRDIKDSGSLLPGHGGVLDRFDGLLAAIPWITFAVLWL